eukprot:TRINITY_DN7694_c0_g1_i2.p1 TRINITY_DN7694_c0_g1~~TRINITY_DN7694_c0_g1_i2.p1  ORF type:complete len:332 (+),score=58.06 TRINITY_DN7694_c0_g1_i2:104-1099(+)
MSATSGGLTTEALRSRDEQYQLELRAAREADLLSVQSGRSALSALSAASNSSRRSRPRRIPVTCDVRILSCEISGAALPPPPRPQGPRRFRVSMTHRGRKVVDAPAVARSEKTPKGVVHRCAWSSEKASGTVATAVNRHAQLRPPLLFILELSEDAPGLSSSALGPADALARHTVVLDEFHPGSRRGRVSLGGVALVIIEVAFDVLQVPSASSTPAPEDGKTDALPATRGHRSLPSKTMPQAARYPSATDAKQRSRCRCSADQDGEEPQVRRRRTRVAFRTPGEDHQPPKPPAGGGMDCSSVMRQGGYDDRTPTDPCSKGHPACNVQCAIS